MIRIELVRVGNVLIGRTVSDRWNLLQLIGDAVIEDSRSSAALKRVRRLVAREFGDEFTLCKVRGGGAVMEATAAEMEALGEVNATRLTAAA